MCIQEMTQPLGNDLKKRKKKKLKLLKVGLKQRSKL
jgi:hypothetical protein